MVYYIEISSANKEIGSNSKLKGSYILKLGTLLFKNLTKKEMHKLKRRGDAGSPYLTPLKIYIDSDNSEFKLI